MQIGEFAGKFADKNRAWSPKLGIITRKQDRDKAQRTGPRGVAEEDCQDSPTRPGSKRSKASFLKRTNEAPEGGGANRGDSKPPSHGMPGRRRLC